ncbi:MAG TPA: cell division protein FtsZ [Magnetospirillaceae bacterium]|jgi:cell division protein FtsZ
MINFHPSGTGPGNETRPRITVIGVGGAGGNAVNNMIAARLEGVEFVVANTDGQALAQSRCDRRIQLGAGVTQGLGAGARPDIGRAAAEETLDEVVGQVAGSNMVFITAGMGGGTGTGAAPVIARAAREHGILTVGVVTKPFHFEGAHRMKLAEQGIEDLSQYVDTLIIIPNQNLFRIANPKTTFAEAFQMADDVLHSGVRGVTDLMVMPGLINLDFADIRTVMSEMGKAMMGTGEAEGEDRAIKAAEAAISNPLLDDVTMKGAKGVLINITGGMDITLFEVDEAAQRVAKEIDSDANIIFGSTFDEAMEGRMRVSVVATGIEPIIVSQPRGTVISLLEPGKRQAPTLAPRAPTLGDRVATAERLFVTPMLAQNAAAAAQAAQAAQAQPEPTPPATAQAKAETEMALAVEMPAPAPAPVVATVSTQPAISLVVAEHGASLVAAPDMVETPVLVRAEPAVAPRSEPTLVIRSAQPARPSPVQGTLGMDLPASPRLERVEPRIEPRAEAKSAPAPVEPMSVGEQPRRGFIGRLASHVRQASQPAAAAQAPAPATAASAPAQQPTRISPADRLPTSRAAEEDLLDIPAFLRRQAN